MLDQDEKHHIRRTQQGDTEAFNPLVVKYQPRVYSHILGKVKDTETAKDLCQETWLKAFRAIQSFRFQSAFSSWIYRIAENACIDYFRKQKHHTDIQPLHTTDEHGMTHAHPDPLKDLEHQECRLLLQEAIAQLTPIRRRVFHLYYEEELPVKTIAARLSKSEGTIKSHLRNAEYQYNSQGLPTAIIRDGKVEVAYQYDASGHNVKETLGNGVTIQKKLDANGLLLSSVHRSPQGELLSEITYQRDKRGLVTHETRALLTPGATLENSVIVYAYDALGQLVKETRKDADTGRSLYSYRYKYDAQNNRTHKISHDGVIVRYDYNAAGQLLKETVTRPAAAASHRVFNAFATLQSFEESRSSDTESRVINYTYDDNGNLMREQVGSQIVNYEYDVEGRLVAFDTPHGRTEYVLTPDGKRVGIVKDDKITRMIHDQFDVNLEVGAEETRYLSALGIDQVLLKEESGKQFYYHRATANSIFQLSDAKGDVVNTYDYDAFGVPVSTHENVEETKKFSAREEMTPGTYYFRERLYSSRTGRFLSVDPLRAADANRSFRIGSLPQNAQAENKAPVYQQRLTPSGYEYTGAATPAQLLSPNTNAVASSPLFHQRLIAGTTGLDVSGYIYVGNNPANHTDPTGEIFIWNIVSYS